MRVKIKCWNYKKKTSFIYFWAGCNHLVGWNQKCITWLICVHTGHHVTTCLLCMHTCHEVCMIEQDKDKFGCWAMNHQEAKEARHCRICQQHCHWKQHSNVRHSDVLEYEEKIEIKVVHETLRRYSIAASDIRKGEKLVAAMQRNIAHLLLQMIAQVPFYKSDHYHTSCYCCPLKFSLCWWFTAIRLISKPTF